MEKIQRVFFYPHRVFRDRQLDTIRNWLPQAAVVNAAHFANYSGVQVSAERALHRHIPISWKQRVPLINLKLRPSAAPNDAFVYVWGAICVNGPFITDVDNPFCFTGYNVRAAYWYRPLIRFLLARSNCLEIRCMSQACLRTLTLLFGDTLLQKAIVRYPVVSERIQSISDRGDGLCRLVFVGTQFDIKAGAAVLRAFRRAYKANQSLRLDMITHLPTEARDLADQPGVTVHAARFSRDEVADLFLSKSDILIHPTYVESFGMVALEALSYGLAIIASDVYALPEMVEDGKNGYLVTPPISIWDGFEPSRYYDDWFRIKEYLAVTPTTDFENRLADSIAKLSASAETLRSARQQSLALFINRFVRHR